MPIRKYPIHDLKVGESTMLAWDGGVWDLYKGRPKNFRSMCAAICQHQRLYNKKFQWSALLEGMRVTRIK